MYAGKYRYNFSTIDIAHEAHIVRALDTKLNRYRSCLTGVERAVNTYGEGLELDAAKADCTKAWADLSSSLTGLKGVKNMPKVGQPGSVSVVDEKTGEALVVPEPTAGVWQ